jgi:hypothetical protein
VKLSIHQQEGAVNTSPLSAFLIDVDVIKGNSDKSAKTWDTEASIS